MKKLIILLIVLFPLLSLAQSGGIRSLQTKSENIIHSSIVGENDVLIRIDANGNEHPIVVDGTTIIIENDTIKGASQYILPTASTTTLGGVKVDGSTITILNGVISSQGGINYSVQTLTGSTPTWNVSNGINAKFSGIIVENKTITLSNLVAGTSGNLSIRSGNTYIITFSGYTNRISPAVIYDTNKVRTSGSNYYDIFSWYYDGNILWWNGGLIYN